jgi:hypothetical protein
LAIEAGQGLKGEDVAMVLNQITMQRGAPEVLFCDNSSEFASQAMDLSPIGREYESTSPDRASPRTMRSSNRSTEP